MSDPDSRNGRVLADGGMRCIAWLLGYRAAEDVEDGRLVVFRGDRHFYAWRDAVRDHLRRR